GCDRSPPLASQPSSMCRAVSHRCSTLARALSMRETWSQPSGKKRRKASGGRREWKILVRQCTRTRQYFACYPNSIHEMLNKIKICILLLIVKSCLDPLSVEKIIRRLFFVERWNTNTGGY